MDNKAIDTTALFHKYRTILICLVLVLATLAVYWQVKHFSFVNYDDQLFVEDNYHVQRGLTWENVAWAFTDATKYSGYWAPVTWLSFLIDYEINGKAAGGYHLTNVLFHAANTILLFFFLKQSTGSHWRSGFVAALFALHPLHVESVAWVTERKDVLSTFFWMLALICYGAYARNPGRKKMYLFVLLLFSFGLMAKPMLVTLPFVFLLLDYWPLSRVNFGRHPACAGSGGKRSAISLIVEKTPFFLIVFQICVVTYIMQEIAGALAPLDSYPISVRIANALVSYSYYILKTLWPVNLAVPYPHPGMPSGWQIAGAVVFAGGISFLSIRLAQEKPWFLVGWFWYIGTLIPVIGLVQMGSYGMADRYTYIPLIGLFIIIAWGVPELIANRPYKTMWLATLSTIILIILMAVTEKQVRLWENSFSLFKHAITVTSNNFVAHSNLGLALAGRGRIDDALHHYREAIRIQPNYSIAYNNLGVALAERGQAEDAIWNFRKALRLKPDYAQAHYNLGVALAKKGQTDDAIRSFLEALRFEPDSEETHNNLAIALYARGSVSLAIRHFELALEINPTSSVASNNLKNILMVKQNKETHPGRSD